MTTRRVVVVSAGLSQPSSTRLLADRLATATSDALLQQGVETEVRYVELRQHAHGLADHLLTGFASGPLRDALDDVASADAVIAVTPVFQASYSGLFKTFFDVLEDGALAGTPVLLGATAGTARHSLALEFAVRPLLAYLKASVVPTAVFAASEDFGGTAHGALSERVARAGEELAALVADRPTPARVDAFAVPEDFEALLNRA